ncbi:MAG TPA: hypothetical protein DCM08_14580 [Microscillaceae bacterium]|nr:hypothetical protein [Microscillaceae bacterium]
MQRRHFIKLGSVVLLPWVYGCGTEYDPIDTVAYPIQLQSDIQTGHLIWQAAQFPWVETSRKKPYDVLVVGGGVAGLSAAYALRNTDLLVCELSDRWGGTAGSQAFKGLEMCQGAHYDLTYPDYFGAEAMETLTELNVVKFNTASRRWEFVDKQWIIDDKTESLCYSGGYYREDVLPDSPTLEPFFERINSFIGQMRLPTRLIDPKLHPLNTISFEQYLQKDFVLSDELVRAINYQLMDDFGGQMQEVSALAGIYYYAGRPYFNEQNETFSPPEGNFYFVKKLMNQLPPDKLRLKHLIKKIEKKTDVFEVEIIDVAAKQRQLIQAKAVVYAGQKHALKYVFPQDYKLFEHNQYSPWVVMNFVLHPKADLQGLDGIFWQNEVVAGKRPFLGFVDSAAQTPQAAYRTLTAYFCFSPQDRGGLLDFEKKANDLANDAAERISSYFKVSKAYFDKQVVKVFVNLMGHAMPIPTTGYLFADKNAQRSEKGMIYAGVDNSRLPLFVEALDSGLEAAKQVKNFLKMA